MSRWYKFIKCHNHFNIGYPLEFSVHRQRLDRLAVTTNDTAVSVRIRQYSEVKKKKASIYGDNIIN